MAAAGSGARLGAGGPKAFVEAAGSPLLGWSLTALGAAKSIEAIVIAAPPGEEDRAAAIANDAGVEAGVVSGGEARSESVAAALAASASELIAVHDAARPLVTAELVDAIVSELAASPGADAVIAAAPLTDTVKRSREPRPHGDELPDAARTVAATESRDEFWVAQTPQVFRADALRRALDASTKALAGATDDAYLIEEAGGTVLLHAAPAENLKVTTPADLRLAELLLLGRP